MSDGKSERMKVVDNLMNLILKKKFAVFGSILREIFLFKVRVGPALLLEFRD